MLPVSGLVMLTVSLVGPDPEQPFCGSGSSQFQRHEDTIRVEHIVSERLAFYETMVPVERVRRLEIIPGTRLKAEARYAACSCSGNDVVQHRAPRSPSTHGLNGMHRLDFTVIRRELLQRTHAQEHFIVPDRPKADVG